MHDVDQYLNNKFHLNDGKNIEISGGLLICLPSNAAIAFCEKLKLLLETEAWIVEKVTMVRGRQLL